MDTVLFRWIAGAVMAVAGGGLLFTTSQPDASLPAELNGHKARGQRYVGGGFLLYAVTIVLSSFYPMIAIAGAGVFALLWILAIRDFRRVQAFYYQDPALRATFERNRRRKVAIVGVILLVVASLLFLYAW